MRIVHAGRDGHGLPGGLDLGEVGNRGVDGVGVEFVFEGHVASLVGGRSGDPLGKGGVDLGHGSGSSGSHHPVIGVVVPDDGGVTHSPEEAADTVVNITVWGLFCEWLIGGRRLRRLVSGYF